MPAAPEAIICERVEKIRIKRNHIETKLSKLYRNFFKKCAQWFKGWDDTNTIKEEKSFICLYIVRSFWWLC